jgi:type I restriction enzyme R subunit
VSRFFNAAQIEFVAMDYLSNVVYVSTIDYNISPEGPACERRDYDQVVLIGRIQNAIENINPNITPDTEKFVEEAGV